MGRQEEILRVMAPGLRTALRTMSSCWDEVEEIRLRAGQPLAVTQCGTSVFVEGLGGHQVTMEEIRDTVNLLSSYSRYAFEDKIRQGFLTIQGGHRVGLAGRVIRDQNADGGTVKTISPITFLNIRIARQMIGCADQVLPLLRERDEFHDTLLISPPGMGKTTLLRDLIRLVSYQGMTVGVVDERSELAACYQGIPQNDLGPRTDVLDGCPKAEGLMMMVRTMAPQILAVDEIGSKADYYALEYAMHCGCRLLVTAHGSCWEEALRRPNLGRWLEEGRFGRYIVIEKRGIGQNRMFRYQVCDQKGKIIASVQSSNE